MGTFRIAFSEMHGPFLACEFGKATQHFCLNGSLQEKRSKLHGSAVELLVYKGSNRDLPTQAIGRLRILEGARPKVHPRYADLEVDWPEWQEAPFQATAFLEDDAYNAAESLCQRAIELRKLVRCELVVNSDDILKDKTYQGPRTPDVLDYSCEQAVMVEQVRFDPVPTPQPAWWDTFVKSPRSTEGPKTHLVVQITSCRNRFSFPWGRITQLFAEGRVVNSHPESAIKKVLIDFKEYEKDGKGAYPNEHVPGSFSYDQAESVLFLDLHYRAADLEGSLYRLFHLNENSTGFIAVWLCVERDALSENGRNNDGSVDHWEAILHQNFQTTANSLSSASGPRTERRSWFRR